MKVLSYEEALHLTTRKNHREENTNVANKFQMVFYLVFAMAIFAYNPVVGGIAFLEKEPNTFLCKAIGSGDWKECHKEEICRNRTQEGFHFLADKTDPDYLDNWELKLDLLCESSSNVGFLGSSFFIGVIFGLLITPKLSDLYGRK